MVLMTKVTGWSSLHDQGKHVLESVLVLYRNISNQALPVPWAGRAVVQDLQVLREWHLLFSERHTGCLLYKQALGFMLPPQESTVGSSPQAPAPASSLLAPRTEQTQEAKADTKIERYKEIYSLTPCVGCCSGKLQSRCLWGIGIPCRYRTHPRFL